MTFTLVAALDEHQSHARIIYHVHVIAVLGTVFFLPSAAITSISFKFIHFARIRSFSFLLLTQHVSASFTMIKSKIRRASQPLNLMSYLGHHNDLRNSPFIVCFCFGNKSGRYLRSPPLQPLLLSRPVNLYNRRQDPRSRSVPTYGHFCFLCF